LALAKIFDGYSASDIKDVCQAAQLKIVNELFSSPGYKEPIEGEDTPSPRDLVMKDFREIIERRKPSVSNEMIRAYYKWSEQFKAL
jgi:SpoVK/Ycf46/Vps4 family AAA+-type ATPase